jgi:site-specific DNA-methyltransferase (adenine-specific)
MVWQKIDNGDCLNLMEELEDCSIDLILCDLPYGTTDVKGWDKIIPIDKLWQHYKRIIKEDGNIVLFGSQPFTSYLVASNSSMFRYEWIWDKTRGANFLNANCQPMKSHENILVFSKLPTSPNKKGNAKYFPQKEGEEVYTSKLGKRTNMFNGGEVERVETELKGKHPKTIQTFKKDGKLHPTQKPVALCEFLIRSYTDENDVVLDNCMGSGSTGIACINSNRNFIGMEKDEKYFKIAEKRIVDRIVDNI